MSNCVKERPNGKVYRARKPPAVVFYEGDWYNESYLLVIRCTDLLDAEQRAQHEAERNGVVLVTGGTFGWWRETICNHEPYWAYDSVRGVPGFTFRVD